MTGAITSLPCHHPTPWLATPGPCTPLLASLGHSSEDLAPASLTQAVRMHFLRKLLERCCICQGWAGWCWLLWKQQGQIQGPQHPPCTQDQILSSGLWLNAIGHERAILVASGHCCPQPARVPSSPGTGSVTLSYPTCVTHRVFPCMGLPRMGDDVLDLGHHLSSQPARGPDPAIPPGTAWHSLAPPGHHGPRKAFCAGTKTSPTWRTATGSPKCHPDQGEVGRSDKPHRVPCEHSQPPPLARQVPTRCQAPTHPRLIPALLVDSSAR